MFTVNQPRGKVVVFKFHKGPFIIISICFRFDHIMSFFLMRVRIVGVHLTACFHCIYWEPTARKVHRFRTMGTQLFLYPI